MRSLCTTAHHMLPMDTPSAARGFSLQAAPVQSGSSGAGFSGLTFGLSSRAAIGGARRVARCAVKSVFQFGWAGDSLGLYSFFFAHTSFRVSNTCSIDRPVPRSDQHMGKKARHVSEPAYWVPPPKGSSASLGLAALHKAGVSKKKATQLARGKKQHAPKLDPKQAARAKKASKAKGKGRKK